MESPKDFFGPRAFTLKKVKNTIEDFKKSAQSVKLAGFDGVEVYGANGYLPAQFLEDGSNQRTDIYGGSLKNRTPIFRFTLRRKMITRRE